MLTFQAAWNDFFAPNLFLTSPDKFTLPVGLVSLRAMFGGTPTTIFAGITLVMIPVLIVYLFAQRRLTESIALTGIARVARWISPMRNDHRDKPTRMPIPCCSRWAERFSTTCRCSSSARVLLLAAAWPGLVPGHAAPRGRSPGRCWCSAPGRFGRAIVADAPAVSWMGTP